MHAELVCLTRLDLEVQSAYDIEIFCEESALHFKSSVLLAGMKALVELSLAFFNFAEGSLDSLAELPALRRLLLSGTFDSLRDLLPALGRMNLPLEWLRLDQRDQHFTPEGDWDALPPSLQIPFLRGFQHHKMIKRRFGRSNIFVE